MNHLSKCLILGAALITTAASAQDTARAITRQSVMAAEPIIRMEFTDSRKRNYWSQNGPYSVDGTIQPGIDHPLDFNKKPLPINGGEVFHPFDKRPS